MHKTVNYVCMNLLYILSINILDIVNKQSRHNTKSFTKSKFSLVIYVRSINNFIQVCSHLCSCTQHNITIPLQVQKLYKSYILSSNTTSGSLISEYGIAF